MFGPYVHKRQSFAFEKEVRIFLCTFIDRELHPANGVEPKTGYKVELALDQAIDTVFIAPEAPKWFVPLIESLIKRYQLSWPVQQSDLARDPVGEHGSARHILNLTYVLVGATGLEPVTPRL